MGECVHLFQCDKNPRRDLKQERKREWVSECEGENECEIEMKRKKKWE